MILGAFNFSEYRLDYPQFLFCGSFNPLHIGHIRIADYIYRKYGVPVDFEISLNNVDINKGIINLEEAKKRFKEMYNLRTPAFSRLYITDDARYLEKARCFPEVTIVCGFDTISALLHGDYYEDDFQEAMDEFDELGIKWLAFPRGPADGRFGKPGDFNGFPQQLLKNITIVSVDEMPLMNISSRQIRKEAGKLNYS